MLYSPLNFRPSSLYLGLFIALIVFPLQSSALEHFISWVSELRVQSNGHIQITETLDVNIEGQKIQRGLLRSFPRYFLDENQSKHHLAYEFLHASRINSKETVKLRPSLSTTEEEWLVPLAEDRDYLLPGKFQFILGYEVRGLIMAQSKKEFFRWNITGLLPLQATAVQAVIFPPDILEPKNIIAHAKLAKSSGTAQSYKVGLEILPNISKAPGERNRLGEAKPVVSFTSPRMLEQNEALIVEVSWPPGIVLAAKYTSGQ